MILHIMPDEKFIDYAIELFEFHEPNNNHYVILHYNKDKKLKYVKSKKVEILLGHEILNDKFLKTIHKYEFIVIHQMTASKMRFLQKIPKDIKTVWLGWGGDFYDLIVGGEKNLYLEKTRLLWKKNDSFFRKILTKIAKNLIYNQVQLRTAAIQRVDFFGPILSNEYDLLKKKIPGFKAKFVPFSYAELSENKFKGVENLTAHGHNILLGNSSSYTNNHKEAIDLLAHINFQEGKIITPLSYRDPLYRESIILYGYEMLGDKFLPLTEFMPLEEYNKVISTCSIVIMNHLRQQGTENINTTMYLGAKIFLNPQNPVYSFFKNKNAHIFSIDELKTKGTLAFEPLTKLQIDDNRNILREEYSPEAVETKMKDFLKIIRDDMVN